MKRNRGPTNRNWIRGAADRDERAENREVPVAKGTWRKFSGRATKVCAMTRGSLAFAPERVTPSRRRSEESAAAIVVAHEQ